MINYSFSTKFFFFIFSMLRYWFSNDTRYFHCLFTLNSSRQKKKHFYHWKFKYYLLLIHCNLTFGVEFVWPFLGNKLNLRNNASCDKINEGFWDAYNQIYEMGSYLFSCLIFILFGHQMSNLIKIYIYLDLTYFIRQQVKDLMLPYMIWYGI